MAGLENGGGQARPGASSGLGYPVRAIREGSFFYVHNYASERWPCGDVDLGVKDTDASPTKQFIEDSSESSPFWKHAFGKRPPEMLFDLAMDPDCLSKLATDPMYLVKAKQLRETLMAELKQQRDPRVLGNGDVFERYDSPRSKAAPSEAKPKQKPKVKLNKSESQD